MKPIALLAALVLSGAGFTLGWFTALHFKTTYPDPTQVAHEPATLESNSGKPTATPEGSKTVPLPVLGQLSATEALAKLQKLRSKHSFDHWQEQNEIIGKINPNEFASVITASSDLPRDLRSRLLNIIFAKWGTNDPKSAMASAETIVALPERQNAILTVFAAWNQIDRDAASVWLEKLSNGTLRRGALHIIAQAMADSNPEASFAFMVSNRTAQHYDSSAYTAIFDAWTKKEPSSAAAATSRIRNTAQRDRTRQNVARIWAGSEPSNALAWAKALPAGQGRSYCINAVLRAWAEENPREAADGIKGIDFGRHSWRESAYREVSQAWTDYSSTAAFNWAKSLTNGRDRSSALAAVIESWAYLNPQAAASNILTLPVETDRQTAAGILVGRWASMDITSAAAWVQQLPEGAVRARGLEAVGLAWPHQDAQGALAFAQELPPGLAQTKIVTELGRRLAQEDAETALDWAQSIKSPALRTKAVSAIQAAINSEDPAQAAKAYSTGSPGLHFYSAGQILEKWMNVDPAKAIDWLATLPDGKIKNRAIEIISWRFAEYDPMAAADFANTLSAGSARDGLISHAAKQFALIDPDQAIRWVEELPSIDAKNIALRSISTPWAQSHPMEAAEYGLSLEKGDTKNEFIKSVAATWAEIDLSGAKEWIARLPESEAKDRAIWGLLSGWANFSPEDAAKYVSGLPAGSAQNYGIFTVVDKWTYSDPINTGIWLTNFPENKVRAQAMSNFIRKWAGFNSVDAGDFLLKLAAGDSRDAGIAAYASTMSQDAPEIAAKLVALIGHEGLRFNVAYNLVKDYASKDSEAAREWIYTLNMPQNLQEELIDRLK